MSRGLPKLYTEQIPEPKLKDRPHSEEHKQESLLSPNLATLGNNEKIRLLREDVAYALAKTRSNAGDWQKWIVYKEAKIKELLEANEAWEDEVFHQTALNKLNISSDDLINQHLYSFRSTRSLWLKAAITSIKHFLIWIPMGGVAGVLVALLFYMLCLCTETKLTNLTAFISVFSIIGAIACGMFVLIKQVERGIYPSFKENKRKDNAIEEFKKTAQKYTSEKQIKKKDEEYSKWQMQKKIEACKKEFWHELSGEAFETELKKMLRLIDYKNFNSSGHANRPDEGVDFTAVDPSGKKCIIQCKAHKKPISASHVRDLLGALAACKGEATYAVMASLGGLTEPAQKFADRNGIHVWTIEDVVKMSVKASSLKGELTE
jgi:HJR/Mrr/RecB family endonuclease